MCLLSVFNNCNCIYRRIRQTDKLHYKLMSCLGPGSSIKSPADVQGCDVPDVVRWARDTEIMLMLSLG